MNSTKSSGAKSRISRRCLLRVGVCALGAAFLGADVVSAQEGGVEEPKKSQKEVAYQVEPSNGRRCVACRNFQKPASCHIVEGTISPDAWCKLYVMRWIAPGEL